MDSLEDDVMELRVKERDLISHCSDISLVFSTATNHHAEGIGASEATALVNTTNAMVLFLANERQVVGFHLHLLVIEKGVGGEGTLDRVGREVGRRGFDIVAEVLTVAHSHDPGLSDELTDVGRCLSGKGYLEDFWAEARKLALVLHEGANTSLLVPDKQVLARCSRVVDNALKLLEAVGGPGGWLLVSNEVSCICFDHSTKLFFIQKIFIYDCFLKH